MSGIIPPTGAIGEKWPEKFNLPQGQYGQISSAGWTFGNEGFVQQTFLGASIRNFTISAGFGDTSSNLSVNLVEDEYNTSDKTGLGLGDDVYHNGKFDKFIPPAVGSPVFFKFGKNFATIEQSWRPVFDIIYNNDTLDNDDEVKRETKREFPVPLEEGTFIDLEQTNIPESGRKTYEIVEQEFLKTSKYSGDRYDPPNTTARGKRHIVFGGILQSYIENKGFEGNPLYSVQVVDPREILSNAVVILNNYTGSVFNNKNYLNVYGFLEYNPGESLKAELESLTFSGFNLGALESAETWITGASKTNNSLEKIVDPNTGRIFYFGNDMYRFSQPTEFISSNLPEFFPITGQGYSRRSEQGIPWYRVRQALKALFNYDGAMPQEYVNKGFGGPINFRGYNYVVDFGGIPIEKIPQMYFLNFDQLDLLSICQELCDVISHDLFVTLLPVINHDSCKFLFEKNKFFSETDPSQVIAGIIRIDAIDRTQPPKAGVIKDYLDLLSKENIPITNQDIGYELSNVPTDKIVAGAQEIDMYFFTSNKIRDNLQFRKLKAGQNNSYETLQAEQWNLETSLKQQILPFYGFLGKNTPTIPIGFGSYQQILLDSSNLDAFGVGNYYIATEIELRHALESYESWSKFLLQYNEVYMEELTPYLTFWKAIDEIPQPGNLYGVSVPRCLFISDKNKVDNYGYPANPCAPPYGYPLYYKRAEKIGIPEAGIAILQQQFFQLVSDFKTVKDIAANKDLFLIAHGQASSKIQVLKNLTSLSQEQKINLSKLQNDLDQASNDIAIAEKAEDVVNLIRNTLKTNERYISTINSLSDSSIRNARKVHSFLKNIAEKHLGKTFLVKIPTECNLNYSTKIAIENNSIQVNNILSGPYGFKPYPVDSRIEITGPLGSIGIINQDTSIQDYRNQITLSDPTSKFEHYLNYNKGFKYTDGALKSNFNPISDNWEFNYKPSPDGGFFNYSIFDRNISFSQLNLIENTSAIPFAQSQLLAPMDLTNFQNNYKIKPYVRFDNSQYLDLSNLGKESVFQQIITANGYIPDVLDSLNNINTDSDNETSASQIFKNTKDKPASVAFVECEISDQFYLLPKLNIRSTPVFGRKVYFNDKKMPPVLIGSEDCNKPYQIKQQDIRIWRITNDGGVDGTKVNRLDFAKYYDRNLDSEIIQTDKQYLNNEHVYAVITLPGRVMPTVNQRFLDSQIMNSASREHLMTMDVVRGAPGFDKPSPVVNAASLSYSLICEELKKNPDFLVKAARQAAISDFQLASSSLVINYCQPSPVYPDLVALPLMSMERCYGPWVSSSIFNGQTNNGIRYSDIGGKVEFVKDENLAPWNFAGYQLMNEAGALQAQFSNSLLLYSERGSFTVPDLLHGIILAKPLDGENGPLITSISIDVTENSVQTTVKMDLYTSRFGKLQKMKEDAIGKITRERQKIIDQNNLITRRNILKTITLNQSFNKEAISNNPVSLLAASQPGYLLSNANGTSMVTKEEISQRASIVLDKSYASFASDMSKTSAISFDDLYSVGSNQPNPNIPSESVARSQDVLKRFTLKEKK